MKWLLVIFMFCAISTSLIACQKKDDSSPTRPNVNCYPGGYNNGYGGPRGNMNCGPGGSNAICLVDTWTGQQIQVQSCGTMPNGQPMGMAPAYNGYPAQCVPADYCY